MPLRLQVITYTKLKKKHNNRVQPAGGRLAGCTLVFYKSVNKDFVYLKFKEWISKMLRMEQEIHLFISF